MSISGSRPPVMGRRPHGPGAFSPKGGWRVPQGFRMKQPIRRHRKRRKSGKEQPFIDPESFEMASGIVRVDDLALYERSTGTKMDPKVDHELRRRWIQWLARLRKLATDAQDETLGKSSFTSGRSIRALRTHLEKVCGGKIRMPTVPGKSYHPGARPKFESLMRTAAGEKKC